MKRILLLALATLSLTGCSTDDATPVTTAPQLVQEETEYRMFVIDHNIPLEHFEFKLKRGEGDWIEQELINESLTVRVDDSLWVSSGNYYIPNELIRIGFQLNDYSDNISNWNTNVHLQGLDEPVNIKFLIELSDYN